jgi:8-oxo-dGTP pyrophosphatase MutT (NUDIX family)
VLTVQALHSEPRVRLGAPAPIITPDILGRIEEIWNQEKARRGEKLFNGQLFSIHQSGPELIVGWMAEYRHFLAQRRDPDLHSALKIRPLAVSGVLTCKDGIVFGRRSGRTEMDANLWELVPSGSIDDASINDGGQPDLGRSLLRELAEETGIYASDVSFPPHAIAMVEDSGSRVTDIGMKVVVGLSAADVQARFAALENREYTALEIVATGALPEFRRRYGDSLSDISGALLDSNIWQR